MSQRRGGTQIKLHDYFAGSKGPHNSDLCEIYRDGRQGIRVRAVLTHTKGIQ